jgi:hypothetical protein
MDVLLHRQLIVEMAYIRYGEGLLVLSPKGFN